MKSLEFMKLLIEECGCGTVKSEPQDYEEYETYENEEEKRHNNIVSFLIDNPSPTDEEVHDFAIDLGLSHEEIEERIYELLSSLLRVVGKHNDVPDAEFDPHQLELGVKIEMEHTDNPLLAKMIAKDHLSEIPDYYDRLIDMERDAETD